MEIICHNVTSHEKCVVDGIGGRAKSIVRRKFMKKNDDLIVQSSQDFATLVAQLMPVTTVMRVSQADIDCTIRSVEPGMMCRPLPNLLVFIRQIWGAVVA